MKRVQLQSCPVLNLGAELLPRPTVNLSHSFPHRFKHQPLSIFIPVLIRRFTAIRLIASLTPQVAYKNLSPKTRLGVGIAIIAWGAGGLMLTDPLEKSLGLTPTEEDKAELDKYTPKITTVEKNEKDGN
ncbi:hypothetical protein DER46DRAFT_660467 [Fusarium sp. MPI-SDFR-AT-0072]|nr:hypothetical protein DER46DRAFT_660467 [Fusarium sp. MPI-SDFR-AT-0072]